MSAPHRVAPQPEEVALSLVPRAPSLASLPGPLADLPEASAPPVSPVLDGFGTATTMLAALQQHRVTATELLALYLRRIRIYDPSLRVFAHLAEDAYTRARAADAARRGGYRSSFSGLPLAIEEVASRFASPARFSRKSGAIVVGRTRGIPPVGANGSGLTPEQHTLNPWDTAHTAGAATSAAAVCAGLAPLAFGPDDAGQLRAAASLCGVYAHRPSQPAGAPGATPVFGVVARAAEDLELGARLLGTAGAWWLQAPARHTTLAAFRVAVLPLPATGAVTNSFSEAYEAFILDLRRCGVTIRSVPHALASRLVRIARGVAGDDLERQRTRHGLADLYKTADVLLLPATPAPAPLRHLIPADWHTRGARFTAVGSAGNHPATVFPIALTGQWLPIAAQVIGPYLEDRTSIRFAALLQEQFGGYHRPPGYSSVH